MHIHLELPKLMGFVLYQAYETTRNQYRFF